MSHDSTITDSLEASAPGPEQHSCGCAIPIPAERAGYKGAPRIYCIRCDLPVPVRLSR